LNNLSTNYFENEELVKDLSFLIIALPIASTSAALAFSV
jgi:hypothetical protein